MHKLKNIAAATFAAVTAIGISTPAYANASPHAAVNMVRSDPANTSALAPAGLGSCGQSWNTSQLFHAYCSGTGPSSYLGIAMCRDGGIVYGTQHWDGDVRGSVADCSGDDGLSGNWGICLYLPDGDFNHYDLKHGATSLADYC